MRRFKNPETKRWRGRSYKRGGQRVRMLRDSCTRATDARQVDR